MSRFYLLNPTALPTIAAASMYNWLSLRYERTNSLAVSPPVTRQFCGTGIRVFRNESLDNHCPGFQ